MAEETIWKGSSSHWKNFKSYALFGALLIFAVYAQLKWVWTWPWILTLVAAIWALWKWLTLKTTSYELTTERLVTSRGILTKVTDTLELYRVRDIQVVQPLLLRILRLKNIHLFTADATSEQMILNYLPRSVELGEQLRKAVEDCRERKRVRAFDAVGDPHDHHGDQPTDTPVT